MSRYDDAIDLIGLEDWLSQYVDVKVSGSEIRVSPCPDCHNDKYKLYVNSDKKRWICYVCGYGTKMGDISRLMADVSGRNLTSVRTELAKVVLPAPAGDITSALEDAFSDTDFENSIQSAVEVNAPGSVFSGASSGIVKQKVHSYALSRGLAPGVIDSLRLQYANKMNIIKKDGTEIEVSGPWLVFPVFAAVKCVSYQGRRLTSKDPKYVSAPNVKDWLWPLTDDLFKKYTGERLYLVEGVFDALGLLGMGHAAVCTFGKSVSDKQIDLLTELNPKEVVFAWDLDARDEVMSAVDRVSHRFQRTSIVSFDSDSKVDPGDALVDIQAHQVVSSSINSRVDVRSMEFFQWRLGI